jgi:hypothetical protein
MVGTAFRLCGFGSGQKELLAIIMWTYTWGQPFSVSSRALATARAAAFRRGSSKGSGIRLSTMAYPSTLSDSTILFPEGMMMWMDDGEGRLGRGISTILGWTGVNSVQP